MGRLIREDDVMRMLTGVELNNGTITDAKIELRNVKTAYDVDKVVAELEEETELDTMFKEIRAKAIDDVFDYLKTQRKGIYMRVDFDDLEIRQYKEKLKAGEIDE